MDMKGLETEDERERAIEYETVAVIEDALATLEYEVFDADSINFNRTVSIILKIIRRQLYLLVALCDSRKKRKTRL